MLEDEGSDLPRVAALGDGQEVIAEMPTAALCLQEADRIKALPYVADKLSGYYKLEANCHDEDYIKRQQ